MVTEIRCAFCVLVYRYSQFAKQTNTYNRTILRIYLLYFVKFFKIKPVVRLTSRMHNFFEYNIAFQSHTSSAKNNKQRKINYSDVSYSVVRRCVKVT